MRRLRRIVAIILIAVVTVSAPVLETSAASNNMATLKASFDAKYYYDNNPDVAMAVGSNPDKLFEHYVAFGQKEGRKPNAQAAGNSQPKPATPAGKLLGSYSTKYNNRIARATNVELAAMLINGKTLKPGEVFSFTNTVGPRTIERGFVVAPVYVNKQHSQGVGGGICQVSSTLYATMLTVGVPALERHPHSLPVTYLPEGMDATISGTTLDLKFANPYDKPLVITTACSGGVLTVALSLKD